RHAHAHASAVAEEVDGDAVADEVVALDVVEEGEGVHFQELVIEAEDDVAGLDAGSLGLGGDGVLLTEGELLGGEAECLLLLGGEVSAAEANGGDEPAHGGPPGPVGLPPIFGQGQLLFELFAIAPPGDVQVALWRSEVESELGIGEGVDGHAADAL